MAYYKSVIMTNVYASVPLTQIIAIFVNAAVLLTEVCSLNAMLMLHWYN